MLQQSAASERDQSIIFSEYRPFSGAAVVLMPVNLLSRGGPERHASDHPLQLAAYPRPHWPTTRDMAKVVNMVEQPE
jgi:hypothetical protein